MIKPLPGYILVSPIEDDTISSGGLYLPDSSKDKPMKGKVVAMSPVIPIPKENIFLGDSTLYKEFLTIKIGQTVIYKKWTNQEVIHEGKEYLLVNYNELLATIE